MLTEMEELLDEASSRFQLLKSNGTLTKAFTTKERKIAQKACGKLKNFIGLLKERPILGDHPKAHIHEIWWISCEICQISGEICQISGEIHQIS